MELIFKEMGSNLGRWMWLNGSMQSRERDTERFCMQCDMVMIFPHLCGRRLNDSFLIRDWSTRPLVDSSSQLRQISQQKKNCVEVNTSNNIEAIQMCTSFKKKLMDLL